MPNGLETIRRGNQGVPNRLLCALFLAAIAEINAAFLFGLVGALSWQECVVAVLVATALTGGIVFTVLEMHRLEKAQ